MSLESVAESGTPQSPGGANYWKAPRRGQQRVCGWEEMRKDPRGEQGSKMGPLAYRRHDWGSALVSLWSSSWRHREGTNIHIVRGSDGRREIQRGWKAQQAPEIEREGPCFRMSQGRPVPMAASFPTQPFSFSPASTLCQRATFLSRRHLHGPSEWFCSIQLFYDFLNVSL